MNWWQWTLTGIGSWFLISFLTYLSMVLFQFYADEYYKEISFSEYLYNGKDRRVEHICSTIFFIGWIFLISGIIELICKNENIFHLILKLIFKKKYLLNRMSKEV